LGRLPKEVTLSCATPAGPMRWTLPVPRRAEDGGVIATMWARRTIQSIEEVKGLNTLRQRGRKLTPEQEMLIGLSKDFSVLSCLTTFIAVEHRSLEERNEGRPALRRVPVQLAKGWSGFDDAAAYRVKALRARSTLSEGFHCSLAASAPAPAAADSDAIEHCRAQAEASFDAMLDELGALAPAAGGAADVADADEAILDEVVSRRQQPDALYGLLSLQRADGSFGWNDHAEDLWEEAPFDSRRTVEEKLNGIDATSRERAVQTVLVLLLLIQRFSDRERLWRRAYRKACRQFLAKAMGQEPAQVEAWLKRLAAAL
jgi:hypothetical protein